MRPIDRYEQDTLAERERERVLDNTYAHRRQETKDDKAAEPFKDDPNTFWNAIKHGIASAEDETVEASIEGMPSEDDVPEGRELSPMARGAMAGQGVLMRPEGDVPEVTTLRDALGVTPPTTAGYQMVSTFAQAVGAAVKYGAAVPSTGAMPLAAGAGKAISKVAPKLAASKSAQAAGKGAVGGQVAFGMAEHSGFDAMEQRILVAMNEIPALDRFIPDFLAADDPDDPAWKQRWERTFEGMAIGGIFGAAAGLGFEAVRRYAHAVRAGRPSAVLDGPQKAAVQDAAAREAVKESIQFEEAMLAADVGKERVRGGQGIAGREERRAMMETTADARGLRQAGA